MIKSILPSILHWVPGVWMLEWSVLSLWAIRAVAIPQWGQYTWPWGSLGYLFCINRVREYCPPKPDGVCLLWMFASSTSLPGESLWVIHSVLWLWCLSCTVVTSCELWLCLPSYFVVRCKVHSNQKLLLSVHRDQAKVAVISFSLPVSFLFFL